MQSHRHQVKQALFMRHGKTAWEHCSVSKSGTAPTSADAAFIKDIIMYQTSCVDHFYNFS